MAETANIVVATKVTPEAFARLKAICKKKGFTMFDLLQMLCDCLIRFMDEYHNLSEDLVRIIRMFEGLPGWKTALRVTEPFVREVQKEVTKGGITKVVTEDRSAQIVEAFYVLRGYKGTGAPRVIHVTRPMMDDDADGWSVNEQYKGTFNVKGEFERFVELTFPDLYRYLRFLASELGTESLFDVIYMIGDKVKENPYEEDLRKEFEQIDWHKGARMSEQKPYKRTYTPSEETQQKLFEVENPNMEE
jgi:hypothetical protein